MSKLAENIRKAALNKSAAGQPQGGTSQALKQQVATAATGKVQDPTEGVGTSIAEQFGMLESQEQSRAVTEGQLQEAAKISQKQAEQDIQQQAVESARKVQELELESQALDRMDAIFSEIEYSEAQLEDREDALQLEALGMTLRLQDEKYRHELDQVAKQNRIDNQATIRKEAARLEVGHKTSMLYERIDNATELANLRREDKFKRAFTKLDDAFNLDSAQLEDETKAAKVNMVKDVAMAGVSAYGRSGADNPDGMSEEDAQKRAGSKAADFLGDLFSSDDKATEVSPGVYSTDAGDSRYS